ncbi:MAG: LuxR C-terminal-related transcriptional regulator [Verrucomicrobiota bacterium]
MVFLTQRELDVAGWLGEDVTCAEIARQLGISRETVRSHLQSIALKLGVRFRHAVVARLASSRLRTRIGPPKRTGSPPQDDRRPR